MYRVKYTLLLTLLLLICLFSGNSELFAQSTDVQLGEVQILGSRKRSYSNDLHTIRIDSLLNTKYFGSDLSEILRKETNLNITQYGGHGSLASLRLRGSAPSQTQFNWNGIPVNSPTTGSIDLSLLSGGMADAIEVAFGAGGTLFGSGTFGGSINLSNNPDWDNRISFNVLAEGGSWNHFKSGFGLRTGSDSFQYQVTGLYQSSPNRYQYHNAFKAGNPIETRMNDSMNLMAIQQHFYFRLANNWMIHYGIWGHSREKQLPASESSTPFYIAGQKDQSIRQFVRATKLYRKSSLEAVAAFLTDSLYYGETRSGTDSVSKHSGIRSSVTYLSLSHRWYINDNLTIENGGDFEYQSARVAAYKSIASESHGAFFSLVKYRLKYLTANLSYRQVFYTMTGPRPLFSASVQYHSRDQSLSLKGQISNKFRFPTLNDRFWQPGGNPGLLPESGTGYDLSADWNPAISARSSFSLSSLVFIQNINNWIQWVPVGTYWSPMNVRQVRCRGFELDVTNRQQIGAVSLNFKAMYSYTESYDMGFTSSETRYARQLPYVPFHLLRVLGGLDYQGFNATLAYKFTGRRFTSDNHDPWLDLKPYHLADFSIGYAFSMKRDKIILTGNIANLLNTDYQMIRAYPAPLRSFYLSVNYIFNNKNKKNEKP
jgi:outer membrane cobalamin receptor